MNLATNILIYTYREGYHKLLVDFKMFDADGNILPQGNITPNLNEGFMKDLLNAEVKKKQDYKFPQKVYDDIDHKFREKASQSLDNEPSGVVQYSSKNQEQESGSNDEGRVQTGPTESARGDRKNQGDTLDGRGNRADGRGSAKDKEWRDIDSSIRKGVKKVVKEGLSPEIGVPP